MPPPRWSCTRGASKANWKYPPRPHSARPLLRAEIRSIPATNDLESLECIHIGVLGTRSHSATQSDSEAGRVLGGWVLASCLRKHGGASRTADPLLLAFAGRHCSGGRRSPTS